MRRVRSAGLRVAEAQRADDVAVAQDRDNEGGGWCELPLQLRQRAAPAGVFFRIDRGPQARLARPHDERDGAGEVIAPDRASGNQRAHLARNLAGAVRGRHTSKRAGGDDVHEIEIGKARQRFACGAIDHAKSRRHNAQGI